MTSNTAVPAEATRHTEPGGGKSERLHYLDWHVKNAETSAQATLFSVFFSLWGMAFFFLMAGVTGWFSLRFRTPRRYVRERVTQLLIPFIIGALVLTPIMAYYDRSHRGWWRGGSIVEFILSPKARTYFFTEYHSLTLGPEIFGNLGYHLWFGALLFIFALLALPLFSWLKQDSGKRFVAPLARLAKWRGGLLVFVTPLILIRFTLQPFFSDYTGWSDFFFLLAYFVLGPILIADERFMRAIRRDWLQCLILGIACTLFFFSVVVEVPVLDWMGSPGTPEFFVTWIVFCITSWCWTMVIYTVGMRFLDTTSNWLQYSRQASFPFFWLHFAVVFIVAFYVVQWEVHLLIKLLAVVIGSFLITLGLIEMLIRPFTPVRRFFGMKRKQRKEVKVQTTVA